MSTINNISIRIICPLLIFCFASCKKFVEIDPGSNIIETNEIFTSDKTALAAVSGVYITLNTGNMNPAAGGASIYTGLSSDELYATSPSTTTDPFFLNNLLASNSTSYFSFYTTPYKIIYQANAIIEGISKSVSLTDSVRKQLTGEMKIVRALMYFYLENYFGNVPLILTTDYETNALMPRTEIDKINTQIIQDLINAKSLLSSNYPSTGKVRPNKWTAAALLSRVYLYKKDWANAEVSATEIINSNSYSLVPNASIANVFLKTANETIWELTSSNELAPTIDGSLFIPSSTTIRPTYAITSYLLNAFESNDLRRSAWLDSNKITGIAYYYPKKYKQRSVPGNTSPTEYNIIFRLAEQYLIRAEARAHLNNISGCQDDLNKIRSRAGLSSVTTPIPTELLAAIEKENQVEFFAEGGHRWLDLKRTGRADAVLQPVKGVNWQSTDVLFPIPDKELLYNPNLTQNSGY